MEENQNELIKQLKDDLKASKARAVGVNKKNFKMWKIVIKFEIAARKYGLLLKFFDQLGNKNVLKKVSYD